jgi:hypothetical protein
MRHVLAGIALAVALVACGDDDDGGNGPGNEGTFTASLASGSTTVASFSGQAVWMVEGEEFVIGMLDQAGTENGVVVTGREAGGQPPAGSYDVVVTPSATTDFLAGAMVEFDGSSWVCIASNIGDLVLTTSNSTRVAGTLVVDVLCDRDESGVLTPLELSATFDAEPGVVQ